MEQQMIERRLEALARMQKLRAQTVEDHECARMDALSDEVKKLLADIDAEYGDKLRSMEQDIEAIEVEVKTAVAKHGATVNGGGLMAQFNHGRVTYDSKRLDGLALAFPQINECKKVGEPFVTLKWARE